MNTSNKGQSVIEIILASAMFVIVATSITGVIMQSYRTNSMSDEQVVASQYASEGMEAIRSIRNQSFAALTNTTSTGVKISTGGVWSLNGASSTYDKYTRTISVTSTYRDGSGNITTSTGTLDTSTKKVEVTVQWTGASGDQKSVVLTSYMTNWQEPIASASSSSGGMLVYSGGGTTSDTIRYRLFDGTAWSATSTTADVATTTTNRYVRAIHVFASATRNEKIVISRHYDGTSQYIYGQVYDGATDTWGNVIQFSTWAATTYLDVQNFAGTYLANGNFMAVFSDNTAIPKMRVWNGTTWSAQTSLTSLSTGNPVYITLKNRPGTNEVMAVFFNTGSDAVSQYYSGSAWSGRTSHATTAPSATKRYVDFDWSSNSSTTGAIVYVSGTTAKIMSVKIWLANGSGGGSWGAAGTTATQANTVGPIAIRGRNGANEFHACNKDTLAIPTIVCRKITFVATTTTRITPTNPIIATSTDTGIQRSYGLDFENSGLYALAVYSDNTAVPKFKKYNASSATWDANATAIDVTPFTVGIIKTARVVQSVRGTDDMMVLMADESSDLYTVMWDGANNAMYTTPADMAFKEHGVNGALTTDFWYDFAWDAN